jgi:glycosyltransferase involved in cell wall biosynthesis
MPDEVPGRFVLVGDGPVREHLLKRVRRDSIPRVRIMPAQPRARIPALLAAADVALITLRTSIPGAVPSKIYEAMASSLPILLIADGEASDRVEAAGCGLTVPPGDLKRARDACQRLATDETLRRRLGEAGRQAAETLYDRVQIAKRLDEFLRSLLTV